MTATTIVDAQTQLDRFCERIGDRRTRPIARLEAIIGVDAAAGLLAERGRRRPTVGDLAELEPLAPLPAAIYPATIEATGKVGPSALVAFEGNAYSVTPGLIGAQVTVRHRLGAAGIEIIAASGVLLASHRRERPGVGVVVRAPEHDTALQAEVLAAFSTGPPCRRKANRPPSAAARAEAARLLGTISDDVVVDLAAYQALVDAMGQHHDEVGA
jgi:Mu transposase, C-terminal domain